jgi:hypothetical protein
VVPPAQPSKGQSPRRTLSASPHKDEAWPTTKQHLRRQVNPVANVFHHSWRICSLRRKRSRRLAMRRERKWATLRASILSGIPTITIPSFLHCPVSGPGLFLGAHSRRPRQMPLAREDIPHISHLTRSTPPPGPDGDSQLQISKSLSLLNGAVQYGACWKNTRLVGPRSGSCGTADPA